MRKWVNISIPAKYAYACDELIGKGYVSREEAVRDAVRHLLIDLGIRKHP